MRWRFRHGEDITKWRHSPLSQQPRFAVPSATSFDPQYQRDPLTTDMNFKISFTFSNRRFHVPWVTVTRGDGRFLEKLDFTIWFSGNDIVDISWHEYYDEAPSLSVPDAVFVSYKWKEEGCIDRERGLHLVFFTGGVLLLFSLLCAPFPLSKEEDLS